MSPGELRPADADGRSATAAARLASAPAVGESREQLRQLKAELSRAEEKERRRIARVLHDEVGQTLAAARMTVCELRDSEPYEARVERLEELRALVERSIEVTRSLTFRLSPPILHDLGLVAALQALGERTEEDHGVRFDFEQGEAWSPPDEDAGVVLYRVVRELLHNVVKHARASRVRLALDRTAGERRIVIEDDGVGFEVDPESTDHSLGLFHARERLERLGSRLEIDSAPGRGTRVVLRVPRGRWRKRRRRSEAVVVSLGVLLADDHRMFAAGLASLLDKEPDLEVVGTVEDGRQAVQRALELEPDVVAMDLSMPGLSGIEAARQITVERPGIKILCLSMHRERQYLQAALEAGASGYVLKDHEAAEVVAAVRCVAAGGTYLCPEMTAAAVDEYRSNLAGHKAAADPVLTAREREVLQLVAEGLTSGEIAARLGVSERTVTTHRRHLAEKLDIHSVAGLTKYAIRHGLTTADRHRRDSRSGKHRAG